MERLFQILSFDLCLFGVRLLTKADSIILKCIKKNYNVVRMTANPLAFYFENRI